MPSNAFGSGSTSTPSVPWITRSQTYRPDVSKLATRFASTPLSSCIAVVVWVGVDALNRSPARGPISIVRTRWLVDANPATRAIGPSSAVIAVR